ncbi:MAG: hypothetical protein EOP84_31010 [Verrucomicrobiaceae bacterium]|nr:MAG: hypothetical protein EOP84_31010 [Verrucomicrobiaceae bacterium]
MSDESGLTYDCPCCGQGGLLLAHVLAVPQSEMVVCQECDRVWISPKLIGISNEDGWVEDVLPRFGAPRDWSCIVGDSDGVPWHRFDPECQQIISKTRSRLGGKNT